ncbi:DNA-invertase hin [Anatilimnocola aggregata]|uniref:DNA-invertase hin n=1 Tax=Anatilimnocola aggregata TaxID=2528021 RepID=A0A517YF90_9BACT|nr:recombinase family protein [Anatilimnocola aggregata]QDU28889.1 DNA-invertase hin [Anatilimnocola aggregata]
MKKTNKPTVVRCAVYTRKSTEEGLDQDFNSLDAQRDSGEAFIKSQQHEGWMLVPDRYNDGGFTGGNMDRPALKRLMADIEAGKIDCVIVYKVDRLSRSLLDFARMMEVFDKKKVAFVSVTQQFNTASSMGRLVLNVLLSFAQFEREMISERTRDKIAAARRKGKWVGGMPLLGFNVEHSRLVVNEPEAEQVREIFGLYAENQAMTKTARQLNERGWRTKKWKTKTGRIIGGHLFTKGRLWQMLTNPAYIGKVKYKDEVHPGEHKAIVDEGLFLRVQAALTRNKDNGGAGNRNRHGALLRGLLRCGCCDAPMHHVFTQKGTKRYRYYVCAKAQRDGWDTCAAPSLPAGEIEGFVVEQLKALADSPELLDATLKAAKLAQATEEKRLQDEVRSLNRKHVSAEQVMRRAEGDSLTVANEKVAEIRCSIERTESELSVVSARKVNASQIRDALADFTRLWGTLSTREQARVMELLVETVSHDGRDGNLSISFSTVTEDAMA